MVLSHDCVLFNPRREKIENEFIVSVYSDELKGLAIQMLGFMPETFDECCAHNPINVSDQIASSLPVFWNRRVSRRRNVRDQAPENPVKLEVKSKKACAYAVCSLGSCNSEKIPMTIALMHFSKHQMKGDADTCICAFCGSADGHMPEVNKTGKKYLFPDSCSFGGNTLNAKKLKNIEC